MTAFDKHRVACFRFVRCDFAADTGVAQLVYAFDNGPELVETVSIPGAPFVLDGARAEAVQRALRLLHLFAGVSYYKAAVPEQVRIDSYSIDADTAALVETVYLNGLGEFAYRNGLNLRGRFRLPVDGGRSTRRPWACASTRWWPSVAARIRWSASKRCARWASPKR